MNRFTPFLYFIFMTVLALFLFPGAEAATPTLNNPFQDPDVVRVDGNAPMLFGIDYDDEDGDFPDPLTVTFDGVSVSVDLVCSHADCGTTWNGFWRIADDDEPLAETLVANVGDGEISYRFTAYTVDEEPVCYPTCESFTASGTVVNTLPVLTDDASVSGGGMPEDTYTLTITYTDADGHLGTVTATVCDASDTCETSLSLSKQSGDDSTGAVYGTDFNTNLGGNLTVTVSATDSYDSAEDDRTTTFTVDTSTPWLKNDVSSLTSAGENDDITFTVVYCVFDTSGAGTPVVNVAIDSISHSMAADDPNSACKNGVDYSLTTTVAWAATAQAVVFSGSNDNGVAQNLTGQSITINDAPTLSSGSATRVDDNFVLSVSAGDINSDDGDTFSAFAIIEFHASEIAMTCDGGGDCTVTVAESDIVSQRGGVRGVIFRAEDTYASSTSADFGNSVDVTKTSSFVLTVPGDGTFQPGSNDYTFAVENNGNFADTFSISASSLNNWVSASSDLSVTVAYASTETFTITMDVPHVAAGTTDSWSVDVIAGNDDTQNNSHDGTTTVAVVSEHTVTIADAASSADPDAAVTYYFVITNTGNADESFAYTTSGDPGSGSTATLGMGESETVAASHTVPAAAAAGAQYPLTFNSGSESETATTTVNQIYGVTISLVSTSDGGGISPGETFDAVYSVTNTGNGVDSVSVYFNAAWLTGTSGTNVWLPAGEIGYFTATLTAPGDAASDSSSSITAFATGSGSSGDSGSMSLTIASNSRSVSLSPSASYTISQGSSDTGTVTVTNGGVAATFAVTLMSDSLSFATSEITLGAAGTITASGDLTFTIHAAESGAFTFTIADTIDGSSATYTGTVVARVFDTSTLTDSTADCGSAGVVCETDSDGGWDGAGSEYTMAGTWNTIKTITDSNGQSGTVTFDTTIPNAAPTVSSLSAENGVVAGEPRTFIFMVPSDSDGTISHFVIAFGDGNSKTFEGSDLTGSTITATHTYTSTGEFSVTATAYDNSGDYTIQAVTISVAERTVTMDSGVFWRHIGALFFMAASGSLASVSAISVVRSKIPELVKDLESLVSEGIENPEIHDAIGNLRSFQGIPLFSSGHINNAKSILAKNRAMQADIIGKMSELSNLREELARMQEMGIVADDLRSSIDQLELQMAEQTKSDSSFKFLETLQNKFVEGQEFDE